MGANYKERPQLRHGGQHNEQDGDLIPLGSSPAYGRGEEDKEASDVFNGDPWKRIFSQAQPQKPPEEKVFKPGVETPDLQPGKHEWNSNFATRAAAGVVNALTDRDIKGAHRNARKSAISANRRAKEAEEERLRQDALRKKYETRDRSGLKVTRKAANDVSSSLGVKLSLFDRVSRNSAEGAADGYAGLLVQTAEQLRQAGVSANEVIDSAESGKPGTERGVQLGIVVGLIEADRVSKDAVRKSLASELIKKAKVVLKERKDVGGGSDEVTAAALRLIDKKEPSLRDVREAVFERHPAEAEQALSEKQRITEELGKELERINIGFSGLQARLKGANEKNEKGEVLEAEEGHDGQNGVSDEMFQTIFNTSRSLGKEDPQYNAFHSVLAGVQADTGGMPITPGYLVDRFGFDEERAVKFVKALAQEGRLKTAFGDGSKSINKIPTLSSPELGDRGRSYKKARELIGRALQTVPPAPNLVDGKKLADLSTEEQNAYLKAHREHDLREKEVSRAWEDIGAILGEKPSEEKIAQMGHPAVASLEEALKKTLEDYISNAERASKFVHTTATRNPSSADFVDALIALAVDPQAKHARLLLSALAGSKVIDEVRKGDEDFADANEQNPRERGILAKPGRIAQKLGEELSPEAELEMTTNEVMSLDAQNGIAVLTELGGEGLSLVEGYIGPLGTVHKRMVDMGRSDTLQGLKAALEIIQDPKIQGSTAPFVLEALADYSERPGARSDKSVLSALEGHSDLWQQALEKATSHSIVDPSSPHSVVLALAAAEAVVAHTPAGKWGELPTKNAEILARHATTRLISGIIGSSKKNDENPVVGIYEDIARSFAEVADPHLTVSLVERLAESLSRNGSIKDLTPNIRDIFSEVVGKASIDDDLQVRLTHKIGDLLEVFADELKEDLALNGSVSEEKLRKVEGLVRILPTTSTLPLAVGLDEIPVLTDKIGPKSLPVSSNGYKEKNFQPGAGSLGLPGLREKPAITAEKATLKIFLPVLTAALEAHQEGTISRDVASEEVVASKKRQEAAKSSKDVTVQRRETVYERSSEETGRRFEEVFAETSVTTRQAKLLHQWLRKLWTGFGYDFKVERGEDGIWRYSLLRPEETSENPLIEVIKRADRIARNGVSGSSESDDESGLATPLTWLQEVVGKYQGKEGEIITKSDKRFDRYMAELLTRRKFSSDF